MREGSQGRAGAPVLAGAISALCLLVLAVLGGVGSGVVGARDTARAAGDAVAALLRGTGGDDGGTASPWRHSAVDAVFFYGGFYCISGNGTHTKRLILTLREVDVVERRATKVVGPFSSAAQAATACR